MNVVGWYREPLTPNEAIQRKRQIEGRSIKKMHVRHAGGMYQLMLFAACWSLLTLSSRQGSYANPKDMDPRYER